MGDSFVPIYVVVLLMLLSSVVGLGIADYFVINDTGYRLCLVLAGNCVIALPLLIIYFNWRKNHGQTKT